MRNVNPVGSAVQRTIRGVPTRDGLMTFDSQTIDNTGAFLIGELERLDQTMHGPLVSFTWSRDVDLREDVSLADEFSSFTNSAFASASGVPGSNKAWIGKESDAITGVDVDIGKTIQPLNLWALQLGWTIPELESSQKLGRPLDVQKYDGLQLKYNMDIDEQVYVGDSALGLNGLLNHAAMTNVGNAVTGNWATATAAQILADVNSMLTSSWVASGYRYMPNRLLIAPAEYGYLVAQIVSTAGNISILQFLKMNSLSNAVNGTPLEIFPCKWLTGTNNGGKGPTATDSMYAYTKARDLVRFPLVPLQRTPLEYRNLRQITTYFGRLGVIENVYPETTVRRSNLG